MCYQACIHNIVNQLVMDAASREKGMPDEQMVALFGSLGFKDYAPEPEPYYQRLLEWLEEPIQ